MKVKITIDGIGLVVEKEIEAYVLEDVDILGLYEEVRKEYKKEEEHQFD